MSEGVTRLKELLFDSETQTLRALTQRLEAIAAADAAGRDELKTLIEPIFERAGSSERLAASVSEVLSTALRQAEVREHHQLADSIAPVVVSTIKAELLNSRDEMVEALYPITGRMVKAYVASAIKDLSDQINRHFEQNALMLRLQSLATGKSVAELAMAGTQAFALHDLYLIRRGTGALVARWPAASTTNREQAMSGILAALNEFANEALSADQGTLRQIDFGNDIVYLRGSPKFLLAARCSGVAPDSIEHIIDEAFLTTIEGQHVASVTDRDDDNGHAFATLDKTGRTLTARITDEAAIQRRPVGLGALKLVAALVTLPLLGYLAYGWYGEFRENRIRSQAGQIIDQLPEMAGYPITLKVGARGTTLNISGLTPSAQSKAAIVQSVRQTLPATAVTDELAVIAAPAPPPPDLRPDLAKLQTKLSAFEINLARDALLRATARATLNIKQAADDLAAAAAAARSDKLRAQLAAAELSIRSRLQAIAELQADFSVSSESAKTASGLDRVIAIVTAIRQDAAAIVAASGSSQTAATKAAPSDAPRTLPHLADDLAAVSDRVASLASSALLAATLAPQPQPPPVAVPVVQPPPPNDRELLERATRSTAVFFADGTDYRDPAAAAQSLQSLASGVTKARVVLRVVGYTDEAGGLTINSTLALQRAEKVRADLIALGAPDRLVSAVGRQFSRDISSKAGPGSPNRRVEFEVGFDGEAQP